MMQGKQAKIVSPTQERGLLGYLTAYEEEPGVYAPWTVGLLSLLAAVTLWATPLGALAVVPFNLLNGIACTRPGTGDGHQCRVHDRLALLLQHLVAARCPELVTLQEAVTQAFVPQRSPTGVFVPVGPLADTVASLEARLPTLAAACGFAYTVVFDPAARRGASPLGGGIAEELILSRSPVLAQEVLPLYSPLAPFFVRHVLYARLAHPLGPLDVFTTHLAAPSDLATAAWASGMPACRRPFPPPRARPP